MPFPCLRQLTPWWRPSKDEMKKGLTLVEILVLLAIVGGMAAMVWHIFPGSRNRRALESGVRLVSSVIEEARSLTLSAKNDSAYGVHFDTNQVVLFVGPTYTAGAATNVVSPLPGLTSIRNVTLAGGGSNVVFKRLTGETLNAGTLEVYLLPVTTTARTITISQTGVVGGDL